MSKFVTRIEHKASVTEVVVSRDTLIKKLQPLGIQAVYLWDNRYWRVSHEDWGKVFRDVLLGMPRYTADKFDCENYAMLVTTRVLEKYRLNTCGIAIGQSPFGYHGYNIFLSERGIYYLEPQTGDVYSAIENSGYKAEVVILG